MVSQLTKHLGRGRVSLREAAVLIGVSYVTATKLRNEGKIRSIRVGGQWQITTEEIDRFNREGNYDPTKKAPESSSTPVEEPQVEVQPTQTLDEPESNIPPYLRHLIKKGP